MQGNVKTIIKSINKQWTIMKSNEKLRDQGQPRKRKEKNAKQVNAKTNYKKLGNILKTNKNKEL